MDECQNIIFDFEELEDVINEDSSVDMGQSESKKQNKNLAPETRGTAMSFGFRKKNHTYGKKYNAIDNIRQKDDDTPDNQKYFAKMTAQDSKTTNTKAKLSDKNGNTEPEVITENNAPKRVPQLPIKPKHENTNSALTLNRGVRFGFRSSNIIRPSSTGLTSKVADLEENLKNNNNTNNKTITGKRRSKSASALRSSQYSGIAVIKNSEKNQLDRRGICNPRIESSLKMDISSNQSKLQTQQEQKKVTISEERNCTIIHTGMHTNVIVKPTPQVATSISKFTLHSSNLPKPQYPVPISLSMSPSVMDYKNAKQIFNNNRKEMQKSRDISIDSGISGMERKPRVRPRNLEMIFNERHKFEIRDIDDNLSCESLEALTLPKLPSAFGSNYQTVPLSGLTRNTSDSSNLSAKQTTNQDIKQLCKFYQSRSDAESVEEEKAYHDNSVSEKDSKISCSIKEISSRNPSPTSSRLSWGNAGEALASKEYSNLSLTSSEDSRDNKIQTREKFHGIVNINTEEKIEVKENPLNNLAKNEVILEEQFKALTNISESKFAEMAATVTNILLDDETSPTDSLISSSESDRIPNEKPKPKDDKISEKEIDEISVEIDVGDIISPGSPTFTSHSLCLSDGGQDFLIDDEIADQPALLFSDKTENTAHKESNPSLVNTPTLMESESIKLSQIKKLPSNGSMQALFERTLKTPLTIFRNSRMSRAESLDTLSPCESIASDDMMMDFEGNSSLDSIDRLSHSVKSQSGSALNELDDLQLFSELEAKSTEVIREWNNILRVNKTSRDSITSQLPARAVRLLNRSRLQPNNITDSTTSIEKISRKSSRNSICQYKGKDDNSSSDDLFQDKSYRNSMIQDVIYFKKQLIRLRRILQETETFNPFDLSNGKFFGSCGGNSLIYADDRNLGSLTSSSNEDNKEEQLSDLRRQVVYLQGQVDDRDRTIRLQKNAIQKLQAEKDQILTSSVGTSISEKELINSATQTDRTRPVSMGSELPNRSKQECTSYTTHFPANVISSPFFQTSRRHTIISTTFTNLNHTPQTTRRSSLGCDKGSYKPVKTTLIGEPISKKIEPNKNESAQTKNSNGENLCDKIKFDFNNKLIYNLPKNSATRIRNNYEDIKPEIIPRL